MALPTECIKPRCILLISGFFSKIMLNNLRYVISSNGWLIVSIWVILIKCLLNKRCRSLWLWLLLLLTQEIFSHLTLLWLILTIAFLVTICAFCSWSSTISVLSNLNEKELLEMYISSEWIVYCYDKVYYLNNK